MIRTSIFFLGASLFAWVNCPIHEVDRCRAKVAHFLTPAWQSIAPTSELNPNAVQSHDVLENWASEEKRIQVLSDSLANLLGRKDADRLKADFLRRVEREKQLLALRFQASRAQVIFRDPSSWSSSIWINLGSADNRAVGRTVIARNSPVLVQNALVGVVEYVGEEQSRVRLVTDAGLVLAVRAMRGGVQNRELSNNVNNLLEHIRVRSDLFYSTEEQEKFVQLLSSFQGRLSDWEEESLAKGEICGCSTPLWRSRGAVLKGVGFNYNTPDGEGPARDLRSSKALIQPGDLLVTSGLDGVFPPGIPVAVVTQIAPLKEGSYSYELEAKSAAGSLNDLSTLLVLPPIGFTNEE